VTEVSVAERYPATVIDVTLKDFALPSYSFPASPIPHAFVR